MRIDQYNHYDNNKKLNWFFNKVHFASFHQSIIDSLLSIHRMHINSFTIYIFYSIFKNSSNMKIYYILLSSHSRSTKVFAITMWNLIFGRLWKRKTVGIDQFGESVKYLRQTQAWPTNIQRSFLWKINIVEEKFIAQFRLIFEKGIA